MRLNSIGLTVLSFSIAFAIGGYLGTDLPSAESTSCQHRQATAGTRYFKLAEYKNLKGKNVRYTQPAAHPTAKGWIAGLELLETEKFLVAVVWDETPETGERALRHYDKDYFEKYLAFDE